MPQLAAPARGPYDVSYTQTNNGLPQPFGMASGGFSPIPTRGPFAEIGGRQAASPDQGAMWNAGGSLTNVGGDWAALDQHNNEIGKAASTFGVPANLLKSMINRESSGNWARDNRVYGGFRGDEILPFVGIFRKTAEAWGLDFDAMVGNKQLQIDGMAKIIAGLAKQYGGYDNAAKVYFGGEQALNGGFTDELGMDSDTYGSKAVADWHYLDTVGGGGKNWNDDIPTYDWKQSGYGNNSVVQKAMQFVGTPYVWGGIPEANQDPRQTGWDCSGMTYWLDQKYGGGNLPQGSHYQYQYAQQTGQLFTNPSQLQAGDLVFIDTGWQGGAGAEMNNAGHVAVYIGNGQILHAANQQQGTIISQLSAYQGVLGYMHQQYSGGGGGGMSSNNPYRTAGRF